MKWYLNSGSANHLYLSGFFTKKVKVHNIKSLLVMAEHHHIGAKHSFERFIKGEPEISKVVPKIVLFSPQKYKSGEYKIVDFDAVYFVGGEPQLWEDRVIAITGEKVKKDLIKFLFKDKGCYFGSSLGLDILFDKFHSEMELGEEHKSFWYERGLGVYKNILTEVHYDEANNMEFLKTRHFHTLKDHPEIKYGVMFSGDCVIEVDSKDIMNWKILSGRYEVNKYYPEL